MSEVTSRGTAATRAGRPRPTNAELFSESLWLGLLGFGGGLSVLALIRNRTVERHRWLTEREFSNAATIAQMLPGGAAANALAYIGLRFGGRSGAAVAYAGFSMPGFFAILALAWAYVRFGTTPHADALLAGLNAAVVGVITSITLRMVTTSVGRIWQMCVAAVALFLALAGGASPAEIALLGIASGLILDVLLKRARARSISRRGPLPAASLPEEGQILGPSSQNTKLNASFGLALAAMFFAGILDGPLMKLAAVFFRAGLGAYGGGFAIIPHLKLVLAENHWLTAREFADAVAMAKLTPGPVLLVATFIGYVVGGIPAAVVATSAILLGPYLLVVTIGSWLNRVRSRLLGRAALRGLTPAVVGLMAASVFTLGDSLRGPVQFAIAGASALTLVRFRVNPVLVLAIGGTVALVFDAFKLG